MATVYHREADAKVLYDFGLVSGASDDPNRVVFLSERDYSILLNATELADVLKHRVFYTVKDNYYQTVTPEDMALFASWVGDLRNHLGEWQMSNLLLERIAVALENIDTKTQELITWDEFLEDIETTLGVGNAFVGLLRWIGDLFPQIRVKADFTPIIMSLVEYFTWKAPILALLGTIATAQTVQAAAAVGEAVDSKVKDMQQGWKDFVNTSTSLYSWVVESGWELWDLFGLLDTFISSEAGGTGGEDPDNDDSLRTVVNVAANVPVTIEAINCSSCGGSGCANCGPSAIPGGGPYVQPPDNEGVTTPGTPPPGWEGTFNEYDAYKCKATTYLIDNYIAYVQNYTSLSGVMIALGPGAFFAPMPQGFMNLISAAVAFALFAYLATVAVGFTGLTAALGTYLSSLMSDRDSFICDLYNADTPAEARAVILEHIAINAPEILFASLWAEFHVDNLFTPNVLNILFEEYGPALEVTGEDCSECEECQGADPDLWELGALGQNLTVTDGVIRLEPTLFVPNDTYYADLIQEFDFGTVSQVTFHVEASPLRTYRVFCALYDDPENYPDGPQVAAANDQFVNEEDVTLTIAGENIQLVYFSVREDPAVAPTIYDWVEFSDICIT